MSSREDVELPLHIKVKGQRLLSEIEELAQIGAQPSGGVSRFSLTKEDLEARRFVMARMNEAGLTVEVDRAANIIGRLEGANPDLPAVATGSHIDTVPNGGRLDGAYGVLAGLEALRRIREEGVKTAHPLELVVFTNEEGVRFPLLLGSRALSGDLDEEALDAARDKDGISFLEALKAAGLNPQSLTPLAKRRGGMKAFVELHIEQGPILEAEGLPIGVVENIVGIRHVAVTIEGRADHAGTTPMHMRRDALVAAARVVREVNRLAVRMGPPTVATVGALSVQPGAANVVPAFVRLTVDFRDVERARLAEMRVEIERIVESACREQGLRFTISERAAVEPARMSPRVVEAVERAAGRLGVKTLRMNSGAGHDTQMMARIADAGMIFIPSRGGKSHAPEEWSDPQHVELGANVLLSTLLDLAGSP